ncbi:hypothetical protein Ssi03_49480 [Sphaerisporangium siamense]|uniref:AcrR family transcriptional regulator n=1 Tax=Sphaerisporangium siamense TaxID=795645 RepID=A0A7W7D402_9ACTN|nr:TetR/AcrR family transcriptional regulator [Sphaerisporangium siamense]MBB4699544.1 AcrR family transcriptional regulator [Sphaerisporangium siamense]GII86958.1 hypothetical protein Ssi03_49480 [Sphaerisporangium siamense]
MEKPAQEAHTGNRRGRRSRQEILDAAARVMSVRGYAGTSISTLVKETGLPKSAFYHHFESKAGLLSAVMAQGARGFFDAMREAHRNPPEQGAPRERLGWYLRKTGEVFVHREEFLRLLLVLVMSHEAAEAPEAQRTVSAVRDEGRDYMRHMIRSSFMSEGEDAANAVADALGHFGMAGFDGAFVSLQSEDGKPIAEFMDQLADAMVALGAALLARR